MIKTVTAYVDSSQSALGPAFLGAELLPHSAFTGSGAISADAIPPEIIFRRLSEQPSLAISLHWLDPAQYIASQGFKSTANTLTTQRARNQAAIRLLREWLADNSGYDEETWPIVEKAIEEHRPSYRRRFHD